MSAPVPVMTVPGEPPPTLFEYLPDNAIVFTDESHVTVPQIGGMYRGDFRRKFTLAEHGFRLDDSELPDHLPVVLEFAALVAPDDGAELLQRYRPSLELLRLALKDVAQILPYLLMVLILIFRPKGLLGTRED